MTRLPALRHDALDDEQQELWAALTESRGDIVGADGALVGPFNVWLHAPALGRSLTALGGTLRFGTSIDRRLVELAIITVGAHWKAEFEWWAHARMAREHGVDEAVIEAIGDGDAPDLDGADLVVHRIARQLVTTGRLDDDLGAEGRDLLGDQGMVELVTLCGYYCLVSFTLNAFAVALPPGAEPRWG